MFEVQEVKSGYGEVTVLQDLNFAVGHEIFAVLGANGAGKSTLMRTMARLLPLHGGSLRFEDADVSRAQPYELAARGLAYVPQEGHVFPNLTVRENLQLGGLVGGEGGEQRLEEVFQLFPDLAARINQKAGTLSGGEAQMAAVGRALMQNPRLLLLDEPTAGLAPKYVDQFFRMVRRIHEERGISIMLAEQNASKTLAVSDRVMVLSLGTVFLLDEKENIDMEALKEGYRI